MIFMLKKVDERKVRKENKIQSEIEKNIEHFNSFVFKAGAGSGKTYSLIESIKYILNNNMRYLKEFNQKISVITFTNVATEEVKQRLGNTDYVEISTIHVMLWNLISLYQNELVKLHYDYLKKEIEEIKQKLNAESRFESLSKDKKCNFIKVMSTEESKNIFYEGYDLKAEPFRNQILQIDFNFDITDTELLNNVQVFRKIVTDLYKLANYKNTLKKIKKRENGYKKVKYFTTRNFDRLDKMEISHDTLLIYSLKLIEKYPLLRKVIIDRYPYIFIDEYQDTNENVVRIMKLLDEFAKEREGDFLIGYFGDELQNIYPDGVGNRLKLIHENLKVINKNFNRRSYKEIIEVINKIRNDSNEQSSIYVDSIGGNFTFYKSKQKYIPDFLEECKEKWNVTEKHPINCLILTHRTIAERLEIEEFHKVFSRSPLYEGLGYDRLSEELFSKEYEKLGEVQKGLCKLMQIYTTINSSGKTVNDILFDENVREKLTLKELKLLVEKLKKINGETLGEILESIKDIANQERKCNESNNKFNLLFSTVFSLEKKSISPSGKNESEFSLIEYKKLLFSLLGKMDYEKILSDEKADDEIEKIIQLIDDLFQINKTQLINWYNHLNESENILVRYHTFHGTKGREFENVVIIMEDKFGRRNFFNKYFEILASENNELDEADTKLWNVANNLLYVAASRAIKNLAILYVDDESDKSIEFYEGMESIFEKIDNYPKD